jgi:diguanylate cyclase (GGDEF)-like protein
MARKMDYLASHDALTGLFNRRRFEQHLARALETAQEESAEHALCYLDLDLFKVVNDTCGHMAGDELLRQITGELHKHVRQGDILARLGGDEFGVLLERCPLRQALRLAHELCKSVEEFRFVWNNQTFAIGVSIGIAPIDSTTRTITEALSHADTACYVAKDAGRNRVHVHQPDDTEIALRHGEMLWVSRLQDALDRDRFHLAYQTITPCNAQPNSGLHMEILVRLDDSDGKEIAPGAFLPAAERFNLSTALDRWVIEHSFRWIAGLGERLDDLALCSINLSANTIGDDEFLRLVVKLMDTLGVPGSKICFEVTETAAIASLTRAVGFMTELKKHGCRFALDDFGSGMSSFGYLKSLPVDFLKIDGNFVRDMVNDNIDRTIVKSINEVGHAMGIRTIAEFVENNATHELIAKIGIDYAQGYAIARPQPLSGLWR